MLADEAKKEYQKEYMRKRRSNNNGSNKPGLTKLDTVGSNKPPEVIDGKYNREYLPSGQYYKGVCLGKGYNEIYSKRWIRG